MASHFTGSNFYHFALPTFSCCEGQSERLSHYSQDSMFTTFDPPPFFCSVRARTCGRSLYKFQYRQWQSMNVVQRRIDQRIVPGLSGFVPTRVRPFFRIFPLCESINHLEALINVSGLFRTSVRPLETHVSPRASVFQLSTRDRHVSPRAFVLINQSETPKQVK